ncbi:MAG: DUF4345 domain-containing protein [Candidatus Thiodiazotropha sp. (ex Monitilora ramsayi)]|nr:DUF4345 domain-containing protein [Candidatus Thiodiazotropha sp. (ex Monitilora ramsayi)]
MRKLHKWILTALLLLFGLSLLIPGMIEMLRLEIVNSAAESISQVNQHRALHGMMAGLGLLACMACFRLEQAKLLVVGIGFTLLLVAGGRIYSLFIDGQPGFSMFFYLAIELLLAVVFLFFPPPVNVERQPGVRQ